MTAVSVGDNGKMAAVFAPLTDVQRMLAKIEGYTVIANINSPTQTVVSGDSDAVRAAVELGTSRGIRARELPVSAAFHSAHFHDTVAALRASWKTRGRIAASRRRATPP